jgi:hypothetical protein
MTTPPEMRELAYRLLAYEDVAGKDSEPTESPALRVYEKLRQSLSEFSGVAGFQVLASRALALSKPDVPSLVAVRVTADGYLQGMSEFEPQIEPNKDRAGDGGIILISRLLGLLLMFLGEALTLRLLQNAWPSAALDDLNSKYGRKA